MAFRGSQWLLTSLAAVCLCGCVFVDANILDRSTQINKGYGDAQNTALLLNIVRAGRYEPLRFNSITKFSPNQLSDIKVGLPTVTIGGGQTAMQKQAVFSGNITDNSVSLNYEIDPLETKEFTAGITDPISDSLLLKLLSLFPRELIFFSAFSSITVKDSSGTHRFRNDPSLDDPAACEDFSYANFDPRQYSRANETFSPYNPAYEAFRHVDHLACEYHKFQFYIEEGIKYGATFEPGATPSSPKAAPAKAAPSGGGSAAAHQPAAQTPPAAAATSPARFCYDLALARGDVVANLATGSASICGVISKPPPNPRIQIGWLDPAGHVHVVTQSIELTRRSPQEIFLYLGKLLELSDLHRAVLFTRDATDGGDRYLMNIETGRSPTNCFAAVSYEGQNYCVPSNGSYNSKRMFMMLSLMVNLSTSPADIPNTLNVRVSP